ncbi:hypothetical protein PANDA_021168 [Ailuropoda melanoleuca]|uniref:BET1-like protein n=1 Tax=Ailuropoda melanoleuca TaxID=9646 RepID=D2I613_AILME|nr:hypothetical protein PANDA_021168 [Ailuropoda melanoleuca]
MTDVPVSLCCREDSTTRSKCSSTAGRDPLCNKLLLTVSFVPGPFPVPAQSPAAVEEILDRENKRMADSLASKVTRLKSLALDIDRDAEDQNRYLDSMDSDFTSMTGLLTGSVKRFSTMARSGRDNRKLLCGMAVGLIVAFFILSYLLSRART